MLPGKTYAPIDYLMMAWNRKWLILVPTVLIGSGVFVWSYNLPNRFRAETSVLIVPQMVPEDYVKATITTQIEDRLQMISQQILSRSRLERIITEFNLYEKERKTMIMEDVIERMRTSDVGIQVMSDRRRRGSDATAFRVSYQSEQPRMAMQVADRLANLFVQENLEDRGMLVESTNRLLQSSLDDAKRRLLESERKLQEFRQRNSGRLPSQVNSNFQMMQSVQQQLQALRDSQVNDRNRLTVLEGFLGDAAANPATVVRAVGQEGGIALPVGTAAQQLEAARLALRALELRRLTADHPDVIRTKNLIVELEAKAETEALEQPLNAGTVATATVGASAGQNTRLSNYRIEAEEIRARQKTQAQEVTRLQNVIAGYVTRVEASPGLESELTELMRDYGTLQETYNELSLKSENARVAANLERSQIGEQFKILDSARLPERPVSPNRTRFNLMGLGAGFGFGLALVALLEYRDTTLKTDDDVMISLSLPVLAVVPAMTSTLERRRNRRRRLILAVAGSAFITAVAAAVVAWQLRLFDGLVR